MEREKRPIYKIVEIGKEDIVGQACPARPVGPADRTGACPVAPVDGTGVGRNDRTGVHLRR